MNMYILAYIIKVCLCTCVFYSCNACGSGYCTVEQWAPWGSCNATCGGGGVQERQKMICCDTFKYYSLKACLQGCNIPFSWWQANATEYKQCGKCQRRGRFDVKQNSCICPVGYGGSCCDIQTTLATTIKTSTTTTTTAKQTTTKTTTIPTTTKTTTKPTTTKTTKPKTTKTTKKSTTSESTTIPTVTKTTAIPTTTEATTKITTLKTTSKLTTTITMPTTTKTIQPWVIAVISVSCLGIVSTCCFCLWWHVRSYMRENRLTKIKPAAEPSC